MDTTHPGQTTEPEPSRAESSRALRVVGLLLRLGVFVGLVAVAYVAGRHLMPVTAIDAALLWVFGLLHLPAEAVVLAPL